MKTILEYIAIYSRYPYKHCDC